MLQLRTIKKFLWCAHIHFSPLNGRHKWIYTFFLISISSHFSWKLKRIVKYFLIPIVELFISRNFPSISCFHLIQKRRKKKGFCSDNKFHLMAWVFFISQFFFPSLTLSISRSLFSPRLVYKYRKIFSLFFSQKPMLLFLCVEKRNILLFLFFFMKRIEGMGVSEKCGKEDAEGKKNGPANFWNNNSYSSGWAPRNVPVSSCYSIYEKKKPQIFLLFFDAFCVVNHKRKSKSIGWKPTEKCCSVPKSRTEISKIELIFHCYWF